MESLKDKHTGEICWIIGKGPSLQFLKREDIGEGPVIALNQAIVAVESLGLPNVVYSMQKDGGNRRRFRTDNFSPDCDHSGDCGDRCGDILRPKGAILLLHEKESKYCFPDYPDRHVLDLQSLGLPGNVASLIFAVKTAQYMGCNKFNFVSCDVHVNGNISTYVPEIGIVSTNDYGFYIEEKRLLRPHITGLECTWITPERGAKPERTHVISIVVPVFNQHEMTWECLSAIRAHTRNYEIIIVDNGSTPPIEGAMIRNTTNLGYPVAVNQGIRAAKGETIVLLNNDVIVTENWFEGLRWYLPQYAIVGPLTNYCAGMQQVALPVYQDEQELNREAKKWGKDHTGESQAVNWLIGFCMAFQRSLFDEIGPFDESLWPASGEEIDFCFRARAAGYKIGIARDVYVHHFGSQTFMAMHRAKQIDYGEVCKMTEDHVAKKWGQDFWSRQVAA